jgi:aspartate/methionine/tyrosine aminotransferase
VIVDAGITPLRNAISDKVARHNGISASPEQVIVSAGGMRALYLALSVTVRSGDEVLIPDPGWPNFAMAVQLLQATPVRYPLHPENPFLPHVAATGHQLLQLLMDLRHDRRDQRPPPAPEAEVPHSAVVDMAASLARV